MTEGVTPLTDGTHTAYRVMAAIFWITLGAAILLTLAIMAIPAPIFLGISNYLQIFAALAGAAVCGFIALKGTHPRFFRGVAGALGLWGLANIAWYILVLLGKRTGVFPGLIDIGMIAAIFLLMTACQNGLPRSALPAKVLSGLLVAILVVPIGVMIGAGVTAATLMTLFYFVACGGMILVALNRSPFAHRELFAGILLFGIAFMAYPVRETFGLMDPILNIIGTMVVMGLSLITLGSIRIAASGGAT